MQSLWFRHFVNLECCKNKYFKAESPVVQSETNLSLFFLYVKDIESGYEFVFQAWDGMGKILQSLNLKFGDKVCGTAKVSLRKDGKGLSECSLKLTSIQKGNPEATCSEIMEQFINFNCKQSLSTGKYTLTKTAKNGHEYESVRVSEVKTGKELVFNAWSEADQKRLRNMGLNSNDSLSGLARDTIRRDENDQFKIWYSLIDFTYGANLEHAEPAAAEESVAVLQADRVSSVSQGRGLEPKGKPRFG